MIKKRMTALLLSLCLVLSVGVTGAAAVDADTALETVQALGILNGDGSGNLKLDAQVTRAQLVKMMVAASVYKDSIGVGGGVSLFKDVKSDHWASEYIKLAISQGWVSGYVDGTFRPDNGVKLEEACSVLLLALGYNSSSLAGSYPYAQISKASSIGLLDGVSASQGQTLTRRNCVTLFYNLLVSKNSAGVIYGTTLGYAVSNGQVDYATLVTNDTKGPYVASSGTVSVPFSTSGATVYRNGKQSSLSELQAYDVYYYNANLSTIWIYSNRVSGTLTAVAPSSSAPSSVTVAGGTYSLGTSTAVFKCSSQGTFSAGDVVTLLLGKDGDVVDVVSAAVANSTYYGVVLSSQKVASTSSTGSNSATVQIQTQVACTDGVARTFYTSNGALSAGSLVTVTVNDAGTTVKSMQSRSLSGTVNSAGTTFAGYTFASNVEILDVDSYGGYVRVYPSRLAGEKLTSDNVASYTLDSTGKIDRLILQDATGDTLNYVYITAAEQSDREMSASASYTYYENGQQRSYQSSSAAYNVSVGGAVLYYEDGALKTMRQLTSVRLTELSELYAMAGNQKYLLDENVQVLLKDSIGSSYYSTTLSGIDANNYTLTGWYDNLGYSAGGRIRVIVATPK